MQTYLTVLAIGFALASELRYIFTILRGRSKPSFFGYLIFTISLSCAFASAYTLGARDSLVLIAFFALLALTEALLALRFGFVRLTVLNAWMLMLATLGVFLWFITNNPWFALGGSILVDSCGFAVMSRKLYLFPGTEDSLAWAFSVLAYGLNVLLITQTTPQEYLYSASNFLWCLAICLLSLCRPIRLRMARSAIQTRPL